MPEPGLSATAALHNDDRDGDMTREEIIAQLEGWTRPEGGDCEIAHIEADALLCELLRQLGYGDVVEAWEKVEKWYA